MRARSTVRWVLAAAALVIAAGCSGPEQSLQEVLADAPAKTLAAGTARVAISAELASGGSGSAFNGEGEFDFEAGRGRLVLRGGGASEIRLAGDVVFVKLAQVQERPWLKIDIERLASRPGIDTDSLRQLQRNDPTAVLNYLRGVTDDVREIGTETVRGDPTTHYRATLDLDRAADEVEPEVRDVIRQIISELGTSRLPTDAWIDEEGRLRRLRYTLELSASQPEGEPVTTRVTASFELFQFGRPVDVADPPAAEVQDVADLADAAQPDD